MQFPVEGYPVPVFYAAAALGVALIVWNPLFAVLMAIIGIAGKNFHAAVLTRTPFTGVFLNLSDLFLWLAVLGAVFYVVRSRQKIYIPSIIIAVGVVLFIGILQSAYLYGLETYVLRSIWYVSVFLLSFLVCSNVVRTEESARLFYWALFIGAVLSTAQHMYFLAGSALSGVTNAANLRTISYIGSGTGFLLVVSLVSRFKEKSKFFLFLYYPSLIFFFISVLMHQTRQIYMELALTALTVPLLLKRVVPWGGLLKKMIVILCFGVIFFKVMYPQLSFSEIIGERIESLMGKESLTESYSSRWMGIQTEMDLWANSLLVVGVGVAYPPEITESYREGDKGLYDETGALDHVAFSSYLAHFGLIGFLVYAVFLPILTLKYARRVILFSSAEYLRKVAFLAVVVALMDLYGLFGSSLNTAVGAHIPGFIYGALWGLSKHAPSLETTSQ